MTWTRDLPTVPGFYWRKTFSPHPHVVEVYGHQGDLWVDSGGRDDRKRISCSPVDVYLWYGPIEPPEFEQAK